MSADADYWTENLREHSLSDCHIQLIDPTRARGLAAITEVSNSLDEHDGGDAWLGGQLDLIFCGHGTPDGGLVVSDGTVSATEIVDALCACLPRTGKRRLAVVLDSCFSALPLATILTDDRHSRDFLVIDGFAAALQDEYAWEIDHLGHGVLTFTHKYRGNAHVAQDDLARAAREDDKDRRAVDRGSARSFSPDVVRHLRPCDRGVARPGDDER